MGGAENFGAPIYAKMPGRTKKTQDLSQDADMDDVPPSAQAATVEDAEMGDGVEGEGEEEEEEEEETEPQRVKIVRFPPRQARAARAWPC